MPPESATNPLGPPPRSPRWRAALRRHWVLGLLGTTFLSIAMVFAIVVWALGGDVLPLADDALDASHSIAEGEIVAVEPSGLRVHSTHWLRIDYRFPAGEGELREGHSFAPPRRGLDPGAVARIEFLPDAPHVNRLSGSRRNPLGSLWTVLIGAFAMPAFLMTLWWLRGVMRLRLLLSIGRSTTAEVVAQKAVLGVNPPQWKVGFRFRDDRGRDHEASHWVGQRSPLGRQLAEGASEAAVVYDENDPAVCRLAHPADFER